MWAWFIAGGGWGQAHGDICVAQVDEDLLKIGSDDDLFNELGGDLLDSASSRKQDSSPPTKKTAPAVKATTLADLGAPDDDCDMLNKLVLKKKAGDIEKA